LSRFEKHTDRAKFYKANKIDIKYKEQPVNMRKSRPQHKFSKNPSFNSKISIKQRQQQQQQQQQMQMRKNSEDSVMAATTTTTNTTATTDEDDQDDECESNYETIKKIEEQEDAETNSPLKQTSTPPPPPPPPLGKDVFKKSDPCLFDRFKKVKKTSSAAVATAMTATFDEKASKSFDAVVNELITKFKAREAAAATVPTAASNVTAAISCKPSGKEVTSAFSKVATSVETNSKKFQKNNNYSNNNNNANGANIIKFFKPVVTNDAFSRLVNSDSSKSTKVYTFSCRDKVKIDLKKFENYPTVFPGNFDRKI
jgi:hypothetical protein